ncbi:MAG: hypothetical protein KAR44_10180 [Candidatus Aegiribacteria sp.]|nr:hypothetical protein [Candidatus Aegiribacteria sp.]
MIRVVLDLLNCLHLLGSALQVIPLPGIPVAIHPLDRGIAVACIDPSVICTVDTDFVVDVLPWGVMQPRDICLWNGELAASDFAGESIVMNDRVIPLPGSPDGICEVFWNTPSAPELAVALFDRGIVVLVEQDGTVSTLLKMPGVKSLSACDADGDGDMDLFAAGCGSGVIFVENRFSHPVTHYVGTIQVGVKRCQAVDMDGDSAVDVAGIACADGGGGWWRNPGDIDALWEFHVLDSSLSGPKDICCRGDSIVIASMFSDVFISFMPGIRLPEGFLCSYIAGEGDVILGHRLGFLIRVRSLNELQTI